MELKKSAMAEEKIVAILGGGGGGDSSGCECTGRMKSAKEAVEVI